MRRSRDRDELSRQRQSGQRQRDPRLRRNAVRTQRLSPTENELAGRNGFQSAITACEALIALPEDEVPEDVEQPENRDPEIAALQQCRTEAVATVNATIDAANLAEFNAQVGGDGGAVETPPVTAATAKYSRATGKPPGIPDKITSIRFDTNFNNRWCEPGEIQHVAHALRHQR